MKILAVDTTAKAASVCLAQEEKIIGSFFIDTALTHSRTLMPMIEALFSNTETKPEELNAIAVNAGPGSFTGVRIGVAAVKGLAFAHSIPCVSVSTLESMAYNCLGGDCVVCAVMDARCSQVYNAIFRVKGDKIERLCDDRALSIEELDEELSSMDKPIYLVGDGYSITEKGFKKTKISFVPERMRVQSAYSVACCALIKYNSGNTLTDSELVPIYLRPSQAERERNERLGIKNN